jgi:hypothetical protein
MPAMSLFPVCVLYNHALGSFDVLIVGQIDIGVTPLTNMMSADIIRVSLEYPSHSELAEE